MSCLDGLIGMDGSCTAVTGKLYLKDVGVFEEELAGYLSESEESVSDMIASVGRAAAAQLTSDVMADMIANGRIRPHTFIDRQRLGYAGDRIEAATQAANTLYGLVVEVYAPKSNVRLSLTQLIAWPVASGDVTVTFHDLADGALLHTEVIEDATAGQLARKEIDVTIEARRHRMRVLITSDMVDWNKMTIVEGASCGSCSRGWSLGVMGAYGATIDDSVTKVYANVQRTTDTGGIGVVATVDCDHAAFLCDQKDAMAWPLMLLQASMLVQRGLDNVERIGTRQINREAMQERLAAYVARYNDAREVLIKGMYVPDDPVCYVCNERRRTVIALP